MAKDTFIIIRVSRDEKDAAKKAADARGSDLSSEVRKFLARIVKRNSK